MPRKRGTYLTPELLEKLKDEMRRDRRSGSWILRDALEARYGIRPTTAQGANQAVGVDYLAQTGEQGTNVAARTVTTDATGKAPDGIPVRSISAAETPATATPITVTEPPVVATEPSVIVTGTPNVAADRLPAMEGLGNAVPRRPSRYLPVHIVPVHDGKLRRHLAEVRKELELTRTALGSANLDRDRALAELEQARTETESVRAESSAREAKLVAARNRRPLLARDASGQAYVRVAARDSSGRRLLKAHRLAGQRFKVRRT
jgi:hypothetical protein